MKKKWVKIDDDAIINLEETLSFQKLGWDTTLIMFKDGRTTAINVEIKKIQETIEEFQKTEEERVTEVLEERGI